MKSFNTELEKYAKKTRLKASERHELRGRILSYMEYHPLPKSAQTITEAVAVSHRQFALWKTFYMRIAAGAFAIVLVVVGVPLAAENTVPGDILYPVKTKLNEEIRAQFVNSPYEKIAFETELMERRISEARLLEKEGKLSDEVEAQIAETVRGHATAAWEGIAELNATDAEEGAIAKITFGSALDVQSAIFKDDGDDDVTTGIAGAVKAAKASVDADRGTTTPSYERLSARVEFETTRAHELASSIESSATDEEQASIARRLLDIERKVKAAQVAHAEGDSESIGFLSVALADIQKLISFMTDIDVRNNVELETLVPVVLTPEERIAKLEALLPEVSVDVVEVATSTEMTLEDEAVEEVGSKFLNTLSDYIARAKQWLEEGKIKEAEAVITEAETFVVDDTVERESSAELESQLDSEKEEVAE